MARPQFRRLDPRRARAQRIWVNLAGGIYARYWQRLIGDSLAAGDDDYLESDGDLGEDRPEGDTLDIFDELGLSGDSAF